MVVEFEELKRVQTLFYKLLKVPSTLNQWKGVNPKLRVMILVFH